jgi:hypothetical protein
MSRNSEPREIDGTLFSLVVSFSLSALVRDNKRREKFGVTYFDFEFVTR